MFLRFFRTVNNARYSLISTRNMPNAVQRIQYVNTLPGVGKTFWILNQIESYVRAHLGDNRPSRLLAHTVFYVAPTHKLLVEQARVLLARFNLSLTADELTSFNLRARDWFIHWSENRLKTSRVSGVLAEDLPIENGKLVSARGRVIFMTHAAFVMLPWSDDPSHPAYIRSKSVSVFFDEARSVLESVSPDRPKLPVTTIHRLMSFRPIEGTQDDADGSAYVRVYPSKSAPTLFAVKDYLAQNPDGLSGSLKRVVRELAEALHNPRYQVYSVNTKGLARDLEALDRGDSLDASLEKHCHAHEAFKLMLPYLIFDNYHSVVLASAWLASSQLFHMLRQQEAKGLVKLVNISKQLHVADAHRIAMRKRDLLDDDPKEDLDTRWQKMHVRLAGVTIVPLLDDPIDMNVEPDASIIEANRPAYTLSKNKLSMALMTREARVALGRLDHSSANDRKEIAKYLNERGFNADMIRLSTAALAKSKIASFGEPATPGGHVASPSVSLLHNLEQSHQLYLDPLLYLARAAVSIFHSLDPAWKKPALFIANEKGPKDRLKNRDSGLALNPSTEKIRQITPELPLSREEKALTFDALEDMKLIRFISSYSHGTNEYMKSTMVAFLSAINPTPHMVNLLETLLGEKYNYQQDFLISTCGQTVARSALRDLNSSKPVTIVVPTQYLADQLRAHFEYKPRVVNTYGRLGSFERVFQKTTGLTAVQLLRFVDLEKLLFGSDRARSQATRDNPLTLKDRHASAKQRLVNALGEEKTNRLNAVCVGITRTKARLAKRPGDEDLKAKLQLLIDERDQLRAERSAQL